MIKWANIWTAVKCPTHIYIGCGAIYYLIGDEAKLYMSLPSATTYTRLGLIQRFGDIPPKYRYWKNVRE